LNLFLASIIYKTYLQDKSFKIWNFRKNTKLVYFSYFLLFLSFVLLLISAFFTDYTTQNDSQKSNTKVLFLLDVSTSMKALDYSEWNKTFSRLDTAKKWISNFVSNSPSFSVWLNVFALDVVWIMPIINDSDTFLTFLYWVDENNISKQGTNIYDALAYSVARFDEKEKSFKTIFMLSDGWDDLDKSDFSKVKKILDEQKIKLHIIWVWSKKWNFIPLETDYFGQTTYKTYNSKKVITKLNSENLQNIAKILGANYSELLDYNDNSYEHIMWKKDTLINLNIKENRFLIILSYIIFLGFAILFFYNKFVWRK
jgi:hypothetical protein